MSTFLSQRETGVPLRTTAAGGDDEKPTTGASSPLTPPPQPSTFSLSEGKGDPAIPYDIEAKPGTVSVWMRNVLPAAIVLTLLQRLWLAYSGGFPFNDGALFLAFVEAVAKGFPSLPATVAYNGLTIPLAYPPLAFWIGAVFVKLGMTPLDVVRFLPIAFSTAYVFVFAALLQRMRCSAQMIGLVLLFLLSDVRAFEWLVMGGGLTRALGGLFFALTVLLSESALRESDRVRRIALLATSGLTVAAAILSHPEFGVDSAVAVIVWHALRGPGLRQSALEVAFVGMVAACAIAPWVLQMLMEHGTAPFEAASKSRANVALMLGIAAKVGRHFVINPLALLGLVLAVRKREWHWPALLVAIFLATPRHGLTPSSLILAVFSAQAFFWLISLRRFQEHPLDRKLLVVGLVVLLVAPLKLSHLGIGTTVAPLSTEQRAAMAWVADHAPGRRFVLVDPKAWDLDRSAEWFPVLTGATSVNTVQGREWLPGNQFDTWVQVDSAMKFADSCEGVRQAISRLPSHDYIWIEFALKCFPKSSYPRVYSNDEVIIVRAGAHLAGSHGR